MDLTPDDVAEFWFLSRKITALMERLGERLVRQELGVGLTHYMVLSVVEAHPGELNQQSAADLLGITKGTVSRQIDAAVAAGHLTTQRSDASRRENVVRITAAGKELVERGDTALKREMRGVFDDVDASDFHATLRTLARLVQESDGSGRVDEQRRHIRLAGATLAD